MTSQNPEINDEEGKRLTNEKPIEQLDEPLSTYTSATTKDVPDFGWSAYAERLNGRFAMIGFTSILLIEAISNESFLRWAGFVN